MPGWMKSWLARRAADRAALLAEARALLDDGGRVAALLALDARAATSAGDRRALRRINALRVTVAELAPRPSRPDTATRMHYR